MTVTFAAETIQMVVATGEGDTLEQITVQPSTLTQTIPAGSSSSTGVAKEKRQETAANSDPTTTSFVTNPVATITTSVPFTSEVSQTVVSRMPLYHEWESANIIAGRYLVRLYSHRYSRRF